MVVSQDLTDMVKAGLLELQCPGVETHPEGKPKYLEFASKEDLAREV